MKRLVTRVVIFVAAFVAMATAQEVVDVYSVYATAIEEPWDGVIHTALLDAEAAGLITYEFVDDIGYAGDMERIMREVAEDNQHDIIFGDAFGNEEAVRRVARDYPEIS